MNGFTVEQTSTRSVKFAGGVHDDAAVAFRSALTQSSRPVCVSLLNTRFALDVAVVLSAWIEEPSSGVVGSWLRRATMMQAPSWLPPVHDGPTLPDSVPSAFRYH